MPNISKKYPSTAGEFLTIPDVLAKGEGGPRTES